MIVTGHCNYCEKEVLLSNDEESGVRIDVLPYEDSKTGQQYEIKLFICPHCERVQTVQIDNIETKKLFMKSLKILKKASAETKQANKQRLKSQFQRINKKLNEKRLKLSIDSDGRTFVNVLGEDIIYKAPIDTKAVTNANVL